MSGARRPRPARQRLRRRTPPGSAPGLLLPDPAAAPTALRCFRYKAGQFEESTPASPPPAPSGEVLWVDVRGLGDVGLIETLGRHFGLHRLALEDVLNTHQRPKLELFDDHVFVVARLPSGETGVTRQLALFLGQGWLLSFAEQDEAVLEPVRQRLRTGRGRLREQSADYLLYALLDAVIDSYFPLLETLGERLEALEDAVLDRPEPELIGQIHAIKHELLALRRAIWPLRELLNGLLRGDGGLLSPQVGLYLRDCYDHVIQLIDIIETYREIASGLVDIYLSSQSARMNEIMKVLTIIATIFIPLGTIAGIYGMNFDTEASPYNMPELGWRYGYPYALTIMAVLATGMLAWFWRRGWLGKRRR